jgi:2-keto-4-pentenoate hydratase
MTPEIILQHHDQGQLWPAAPAPTLSPKAAPDFELAAAYQQAIAVRRLRMARGESPRGYKIGFTNRHIWPRYNVFAPIWGTLYDTTLTFCEGHGSVSLANSCQPRIEPETVFGLRATPAHDATLDELFEAIEWVAPGFELVQSHRLDWQFQAAETVADGGLHAHLLVGRRVRLHDIASNAAQLNALLAATQVTLCKDDQPIDQGMGRNVLDSPLLALQHLLQTLRQCPNAPELLAGDVVTTGTWTDAWPVQSGERWSANFSGPLSSLSVEFS